MIEKSYIPLANFLLCVAILIDFPLVAFPYHKLKAFVMTARINSLASLPPHANGDARFWEEERRPGTAPVPPVFDSFQIGFQGFSQTFILLVSPGEGGTSNCNNELFNPHPFDLPPSRFDDHHAFPIDAILKNQTYFGADSGSGWLLRKTAFLCFAIQQNLSDVCHAQILETGVADAQEFQDFKKAVVGVVNRVDVDENLASVSNYANNTNGRNGFHASLVGPVPCYDEHDEQKLRQFIRDHDLNEHARIFTGEFLVDFSAASF